MKKELTEREVEIISAKCNVNAAWWAFICMVILGYLFQKFFYIVGRIDQSFVRSLLLMILLIVGNFFIFAYFPIKSWIAWHLERMEKQKALFGTSSFFNF